MLIGHLGIKRIPDFDRGRGAKHVGDITVSDVETALQQRDVSLGFMAPEPGPPDPWIAGSGFRRNDDPCLPSGDCKIEAIKALPRGLGAGEGIGRRGACSE